MLYSVCNNWEHRSLVASFAVQIGFVVLLHDVKQDVFVLNNLSRDYILQDLVVHSLE